MQEEFTGTGSNIVGEVRELLLPLTQGSALGLPGLGLLGTAVAAQ